MSEEKKRFGLTKPEYDNLMQGLRYGAIIVVTVLITFTIVATIAGLVGYEPPSPTGSEATTEVTPDINLTPTLNQ